MHRNALPELFWSATEPQQLGLAAFASVQRLPCQHMPPGHLVHRCTTHADTSAESGWWKVLQRQKLARESLLTVVSVHDGAHIVLGDIIAFALPHQSCKRADQVDSPVAAASWCWQNVCRVPVKAVGLHTIVKHLRRWVDPGGVSAAFGNGRLLAHRGDGLTLPREGLLVGLCWHIVPRVLQQRLSP